LTSRAIASQILRLKNRMEIQDTTQKNQHCLTHSTIFNIVFISCDMVITNLLIFVNSVSQNLPQDRTTQKQEVSHNNKLHSPNGNN
jgi:hypothetical protein